VLHGRLSGDGGLWKEVQPGERRGVSGASDRDRQCGVVTVDHPEQFPLVAAGRIDEPDKLSVTGSVNPDISREIPVISMANGRVVAIRARLDDNVKKGQLLFSVQSPDITNAFDTYLKAVNDEQLANKAYIRAQDLYEHGAIAQAMLEQA
jgi:cobalt-zinc-cadmium efflux system membrane fusion protein